MKILLIDTATAYVTVSIAENDKVLYSFNEFVDTDLSSKIIPIIDDEFRILNLTLNDIDKVFVCNGPGSFTGIRVGVTIAKTIGWALNKEVVPISTLELMATTKTNKKYIVPMIDARRGNVFAGIYDNDLNLVKEDKLVNLQDMINNLGSDYEFVSYDEISIPNLTKPNIDIIKIISKHKDDKGINPHNVNPNYLKLTEAEENRGK